MSEENKVVNFTLKTQAELEGAKQLADSFERQIGQAKALGKDYSELEAQLNSVKKAIDNADPSLKKHIEATEHSGASHRALNRVLERGNELIPGLGTALEFLAHGYRESAAAAETATVATEGAAVANDELLISMGELAVVFLAIQAATTYWESYKSASEGAVEAQTKATENLGKATKDLIEERDKFNEAMNLGIEPAEKINKQLELQKQLIGAQAEAEKKVLKAREEVELAGATTPAQKDEIKKRYQAAEDAVAEQKDQADTNAITMAKLKAKRQLEELEAERQNLIDQATKDTAGTDVKVPGSTKSYEQYDSFGNRLPDGVQVIPEHNEHQAATPAAIEDSKKKLEEAKKLDKPIEDLKNAQQNYGEQVENSQAVGAVKKSGDVAAQNTTESGKALKDAEEIADRGPQNQAEADFIAKAAALASGQAQNWQTAQTYLSNLEKHPEEMNKVLTRLGGLQENVIKVLINFDKTLSGFEARLAAIGQHTDLH
jgi:DNA repair exonuclease SbcCD ATPase subunit